MPNSRAHLGSRARRISRIAAVTFAAAAVIGPIAISPAARAARRDRARHGRAAARADLADGDQSGPRLHLHRSLGPLPRGVQVISAIPQRT
ncbi:hypothetical protein GCM10010430_67350 [Kitasatospora cystarginea]|uniref:Uncharacterized protein n=1 Tax=Kitasatospora cystarginea TaxID=58350 RepID=A0ABN3EV70_9ACTN